MSIRYTKTPTALSALYVVFRAGSMFENKEHRGLSHLLEHMVCRSYLDLQPDFEAAGIDSNALTYDDSVIFLFQGLHRELAPRARQFIDRIMAYVPTETDLETERSIVLQEICDSRAKHTQQTFEAQERKLLGRHSSLGSYADIAAVTLEQITNAHLELYGKPSLILYAGPESIDLSGIETFPFDTNIDAASWSHDQTFEKFTVNPDSATVVLRTPTNIVEHYSMEMIELAMTAIGGGLMSPLVQELREKRGLVYSAGAATGNLSFNHVYPAYIALCHPSKVDEVKSVLEDFAQNPDKWLTVERFEKAKKQLVIEKEKADCEPHKLGWLRGTFVNPTEVSAYTAIAYDQLIAALSSMFHTYNVIDTAEAACYADHSSPGTADPEEVAFPEVEPGEVAVS